MSIGINVSDVDLSNGSTISRSTTGLLVTERSPAPDADSDPKARPTPSLTAAQNRELLDCEAVIAKGFQTFIEVGRALAQIRDEHLYLQGFASFEEYCRKRWQYSRIHAHRLISAAKLHAQLLPIANVVPRCESQLRSLMGFSPEQANIAWQKALNAAQGGPITAELVKQVARMVSPASVFSNKRRQQKVVVMRSTRSVARSVVALVDNIEHFVKNDLSPNAQNILGLLRSVREAVSKLRTLSETD